MLYHLWQSTTFLALAAAAARMLRRYPAPARYSVWMAASLKFLLPYSALVSLGGKFAWRTAPVAAAGVWAAADPIARTAALPGAASAGPRLAAVTILTCAWLAGCILVTFRWAARWRMVRAARRAAEPVGGGRERIILRRITDRPIEILRSRSALEPGVFGIFRPVLMLPAGIADRLSDRQLEAIFAHEVEHIRRRDNLAAAAHMIVEAVFWFHPLVWWLGERLVEERERACDEAVLRRGVAREAYAQAILKVCEFCLESPLACAAGVTGADLNRRIRNIVQASPGTPLTRAGRLALSAAGAAALALPIAIGTLAIRPALGQSKPGAKGGPSFEAASIKPSKPTGGGRSVLTGPGGRLTAEDATLRMLAAYAFQVREFQITGGPRWMDTDRFDIVAKPQTAARPEEARAMLQTLLADRFRFRFHRESREMPVLALVVGKNGPRLKEAKGDSGAATRGLQGGRGQLTGLGADMGMLAGRLAAALKQPVVDRTGLGGRYDFKLQWTPDPPPARVPEEFASAPPPGPSLFASLEQQLGLRLERQKGAVEFLVIDGAERPGEN